MAKFAYENTKNSSTNHILFELNCNYDTKISFKKDINLRSKFRSTNKLVKELKELIKICCQNSLHL